MKNMTCGNFRFRELADGTLEVRYVYSDGCLLDRVHLTAAERQALAAAAPAEAALTVAA